MERLLDLYRRKEKAEIWRRYCGFLDLSMEEYLASQRELLEAQLRTWRGSALVSRLLGGRIPESYEEFRERAPLTTYEDYAGELLEKREEGLPEKPYAWLHTSGRSGEYEFKWVPWTRAMYEELSRNTMGAFILGPCRRHGQIPLREGDRFIFTMAPKPFISGVVMQALHEQFSFRMWPDYERALQMDFFERIAEGVKLALSEGIDYFYGITSVMLRISEQLEQAGKSGGSGEMRSLLRNPKVVARLVKGFLKAKLQGREIRPRDLWKVKGIMCSGMDSFIYKERIREKWGRYPWETYGCTEFGFFAHQHFAAPGLVFIHSGCFHEFMTLDDHKRWKEDRSYRPRLRLLSELEAGQEYALVPTSFHGGVLVRYVLGDAISVTSLSDERIGLKLPQMTFSTRVDDVIDIGGFTRLTEKTIWTAIESSGIGYTDWVVAKEYRDHNPVLHLYLETRADGHDPAGAQALVHERLKELDPPYRDLEQMAGIRPLQVTFLSPGTFSRYFQERQAAGIDLAHSKPSHMNPSPELVGKLLAMSSLELG